MTAAATAALQHPAPPPPPSGSLPQLPEALLLRLADLLLQPADILALGPTCRRLRWLSRHPDLWVRRCRALWRDKVCVPAECLVAQDLRAYFGSIHDSKRCAFHGVEELSRLHFHFFIREPSGPYWLNLDPSRTGGVPMYRRFQADGSFGNTPPPPEAVDYSPYIVGPDVDPIHTDPEVLAFLPELKWRLTKSRDGERGQFLKINHWPALQIYRTPEDWGWVLESEFIVYRTCSPATLAGWIGRNDQRA